MERIRALIDKLTRHYWSPKDPHTYQVRVNDNAMGGIGLIAHQDPAAFNLAWYRLRNRLDTLEGQKLAILYFQNLTMLVAPDAKHLDVVVEKAELRSWITLFGPDEFMEWYKVHRHLVPIVTRNLVDAAVYATDTGSTV